VKRYCDDLFQIEGAGSDDRIIARVSIPDVIWFKRQFVALLTNWAREAVWTAGEGATITVDTTVEYVAEAIGGLQFVNDIGKVEFYLANDVTLLPAHVLPLDGNLRNKDDYPLLWAFLPDSLKSATTFTLPLMAGRLLIGAGNSEYSETFESGSGYGSNQVTLNVGNLASHSHTVYETGVGVSLEGAGAPVPSPTLATLSATGSTGNGDPFDIIPPVLAGYWAIVAK